MIFLTKITIFRIKYSQKSSFLKFLQVKGLYTNKAYDQKG